MKYADGTVYSGSYANGLRDGLGTLKVPDGVSYKGGWKQGRFHGYGTWIKPEGGGTLGTSVAHFAGNWSEGNRQGVGTVTYTDGSTYTGQWHADLRHGRGTLTDGSGKLIYEGEWVNGERPGHRWRKCQAMIVFALTLSASMVFIVAALGLVPAVLLAPTAHS